MKEDMKDLFKEACLEKAPDQFTEKLMSKIGQEKSVYKPILPKAVWITLLLSFTGILFFILIQVEISISLPSVDLITIYKKYASVFLFFFGLGLVKFFHGVFLLYYPSK